MTGPSVPVNAANGSETASVLLWLGKSKTMPAPLPSEKPVVPAQDGMQGEIRIGSKNGGYDQTLIMSDKPPLTVWSVLRGILEVLSVVVLPAFFMAAFGIWQMARPDLLSSSDTPVQYKLEYQKIVLHTADGYDIAAWDVTPAAPSDDAVIVLSGYAANKGSILARTAFLGQEHRLLYLDFRSFGESGGHYSTMGLREVEDAVAAVRYLKDQGVRHIGIYGFTMGGAVALMTAAREPAVSAIVTEDAYSDFDAVASEPYGYLGPAKTLFGQVAKAFAETVLHLDVEALSPAAVASTIRIPALIIHSSADKSVPIRHADLLKEKMSGNPDAQFWYTDGKSDLEARTAFAQTVMAFFEAHLSSPAPAAATPAP